MESRKRPIGPGLELPAQRGGAAEVDQIPQRPPILPGSEEGDRGGPAQRGEARQCRRKERIRNGPAEGQQKREDGELGRGARTRAEEGHGNDRVVEHRHVVRGEQHGPPRTHRALDPAVQLAAFPEPRGVRPIREPPHEDGDGLGDGQIEDRRGEDRGDPQEPPPGALRGFARSSSPPAIRCSAPSRSSLAVRPVSSGSSLEIPRRWRRGLYHPAGGRCEKRPMEKKNARRRNPHPNLPALRVDVRAARGGRGRPGAAHPRQRRRRLEPGLHLPEGHDARRPAPRPGPAARAAGARRRTAGARSSGTRRSPRCERRLRPVLERDGLAAVTAYIGNPTAHNFSLSRYVGAFVAMSGIPALYSAGTVDQWPKNVVVRAAVRRHVEHSRCPTSTAPTSC